MAFRARLQRAVVERDTVALMAAVHPEILHGLGPDGVGADGFRREWLEDPIDDVWSEFGAVLALGGRFRSDSAFVAPYTFTDAPEGVDAFEALIALGEAVPVYAAPVEDSDTVAALSFEVVRQEWRGSVAHPPPDWTAVRLGDGSLGFVRSTAVRSPLDYRAGFSRLRGRWWMTVFLAGD